MIELYTCLDILDLGDVRCIEVTTTDNIYFDGYADVYDCTIHGQNGEEYEAVITHDAYCYYLFGD